MLAVVMSLGLVLSACGGSGQPGPSATASAAAAATADPAAAWAKIIAAAKAEAPVSIYTTEVPLWVDSVTAGYKKQYDLTMVLGLRGASSLIQDRLIADQRASAPVADVFSTIEKNYYLAHADWFLSLTDAGLPNYDRYPTVSKWRDLCVDNKLAVSGLVYNNKLVPADKAPKKWTDLLDPFWKGKIMMIDPRASANYMGWAVQMLKAYGVQYLQGLQAQSPALNTSAAPAAEQVAAGAYAVTFASSADASSDLRQKGAPLTFVIPEGPTIGAGGCIGILKNAPHPNAAKVLLNYLMSPEAQSGVCKAGLEVSSPINADGCLKVPANWTITPIDATTGVIFGTTDPVLRQQVLDAFGLK